MRRVLFVLLLLAPAARAAQDRYFVASDGVRLHVLDAGPVDAATVVLVPGWTMPAWIFQPQIDALSRTYRVIAFDPRGQGGSDIALSGYDANRRGQDIAELIAALGPRPVTLVGWSLGVLDSLAYVHTHGDSRLAGLVLIDNSVGEEPAPIPSPPHRTPHVERDVFMRRFVASMFHHPPGEAYLERLADAALRTPPDAAARLLDYKLPRSYWKEAVLSMRRPVLYVVTPRWAAQAANLALDQPLAQTVVFTDAGHALFIDDAPRFNALLTEFLRRRAAS